MSAATSAATPGPGITMLRHNKIDLALHHLRDATDPASRPLLLLHGLGDHTPASVPDWVDSWGGAITGLDFTGHGASSIPSGGGYTAELLLGDADAALESLVDGSPDGRITVLGRGLGAYIALQLAGARSNQVHGAIMLDGPGLAGGPTGPTSQSFFIPAQTAPAGCVVEGSGNGLTRRRAYYQGGASRGSGRTGDCGFRFLAGALEPESASCRG